MLMRTCGGEAVTVLVGADDAVAGAVELAEEAGGAAAVTAVDGVVAALPQAARPPIRARAPIPAKIFLMVLPFLNIARLLTVWKAIP